MSGFYNDNDSISNGKIGFSGLQSNWIESRITFPCMAFKRSFPFFVRFTFVSDSIQTNKEGWMIDNIFIYGDGICSEISEFNKTDNLVSTFPNPFSFNTTLKVEGYTLKKGTLIIVDAFGRHVRKMENINYQNINFEKGGLKKGIYFYRLTETNKLIGQGKLMIE